MAELRLEAGTDHVERLAHEKDPVRAVVELIWNSIDAEATEVDVAFEREAGLEAIIKTTISDNGHGIDRDELGSTFGRIGESWKRLASRTKGNKRGLHGQRGEGRLRAFALGNRVTWSSRSIDASGTRWKVDVSGSTAHRNVFTWTAEEEPGNETGTVVTARNDTEKSLSALELKATHSVLLSHFAPVLLNDSTLQITYNGTRLDPSDEIAESNDYTLSFSDEDAGEPQEARLRIIEWKSVKHRAIYYGQDSEHFVFEESAKDIESHFRYSAYVTWPGLDHEALSVIGLGDMAPGPTGALWAAVREEIREHFGRVRRARRREQLETWKTDNVYPYPEDPVSETEKVERAVFDVVAGTLAPQIAKSRDSAKVTLTLLQSALRQDPENLGTLFHEVASLSPSDRDTLTQLLSETTLQGVIKAANLVTSRNKFLSGLERLLFPHDKGKAIGERDGLHPMLEQELWIFGEKYNLMSSERGLTEMLRNHLRLEGLATKGVRPVTRWDGRIGRVDLHLAVKAREFDMNRHLVVELKAPDIILGRKELDQVEDYTTTILSNSAFATGKSSWDLILVGTDYDQVVENRITPEGHSSGSGEFLAPPPTGGRPTVRAFVRRWRDIIDENRSRLTMLTNSLEHNPSLEDGLEHIRRQYAEFLPNNQQQESDPSVA